LLFRNAPGLSSDDLDRLLGKDGWKSCEESAAFLRIREQAVERHDGRDAWKGCKQHEESDPGGDHCHAIAVSSPAGLPDDIDEVAQGLRSE